MHTTLHAGPPTDGGPRKAEHPPAVPPPTAPALAQQKADFTAEGAPPPGWVADAPPVTTRTPPNTPAKPAKP